MDELSIYQTREVKMSKCKVALWNLNRKKKKSNSQQPEQNFCQRNFKCW